MIDLLFKKLPELNELVVRQHDGTFNKNHLYYQYDLTRFLHELGHLIEPTIKEDHIWNTGQILLYKNPGKLSAFKRESRVVQIENLLISKFSSNKMYRRYRKNFAGIPYKFLTHKRSNISYRILKKRLKSRAIVLKQNRLESYNNSPLRKYPLLTVSHEEFMNRVIRDLGNNTLPHQNIYTISYLPSETLSMFKTYIKESYGINTTFTKNTIQFDFSDF